MARPKSLSYASSGVDIEAGNRTAKQLVQMMRRTHDHRVIDTDGGFAGMFSLNYPDRLFRKQYKDPVLVACTDGVGTKLKMAFLTGKHDTVGIDLVAMSVNDLIVVGAEPLFFLDYFATGKLSEETLLDVGAGIVEGCKRAGCALLGGETAEMPGFYEAGEYDLAGFAVGVVDNTKRVDGSKVAPGDVVIGLDSSGLHSNGFSLARKIAFETSKMRPSTYVEDFGRTLGEEFLEPTRIYTDVTNALRDAWPQRQVVKGMAHITGGGLIENIPRVLPKSCDVEIAEKSWTVPAVFKWLKKQGKVKKAEMFRVFNMGIGFVIIVDPYFEQAVIRRAEAAGVPARTIGRVIKGRGRVKLVKE